MTPMLAAHVTPPPFLCLQEGEASFEQYRSEKRSILESLKRRAELLVGALNKLEVGVGVGKQGGEGPCVGVG